MLFVLIHLLAGAVFAGALMTVVVATPVLYDMGMRALPIAAAAGFLLATPVAYFVTKAIKANTPAA